MSKKFLVTGGAGFIGSHVTAALIARGDKVRVLDNLSTGKRENIPAGAEFVKGDITDPSSIERAFEGIDGVFHMAALPRVQTSIEEPLITHDINLNGTLNVLLAASKAGVKKLIYSASCAAYGDQSISPQHEELKPSPKSPYGLQKYVGEHYCNLASMFWNLETVSLRYFNVFGPRMCFEGAYTTVMAVFLKQRSEGKNLTVTGDGNQTRDFVYVEDVVTANLAAMDNEKVGKGEVINIGAGDNHSVNEVAKIIGGPIEKIAPRIEPHDTLADISLAKKLLNWEPQVKFANGMTKTIDWFKNL
ncbi:MAG: NAD-dependent epimerase/dehydratase family protein [Patescibacteria group bacterium]